MERSMTEVLPDDDGDLDFSLPLNRIRNICRLDPDLTSISLDAVKAITLATEKFVQLMAQAAHEYARDDARKTVQMKDVERCIKEDWLFAMLEDAIVDWPGDAKSFSSDIHRASAIAIEEAGEQEDEVGDEDANGSVKVLPVGEKVGDVMMAEEPNCSTVLRDIEDI